MKIFLVLILTFVSSLGAFGQTITERALKIERLPTGEKENLSQVTIKAPLSQVKSFVFQIFSNFRYRITEETPQVWSFTGWLIGKPKRFGGTAWQVPQNAKTRILTTVARVEQVGEAVTLTFDLGMVYNMIGGSRRAVSLNNHKRIRKDLDRILESIKYQMENNFKE